MATVTFIVKATIPPDKEAAFNRWYNAEHCPQALQFPGMVSAHRYKALDGEDKYQYMAVYELQDEETYRRFIVSDPGTSCVTKSTVLPNCRFIPAGLAQCALAAIANHARIGPSACG